MRRTGRKPDELAKDLADADALIVRSATKVTKELLAAAPKLRIIGRAGSGVDNIDMPAASGKGVLVVNAPGANSIAVAEQALALMLSLARSVPAADQAMKAGKWEKKKFMGTELRNKTLGIAGLGRIGQEVAARARSFGMTIIAYDPYISADVAASIGVELKSLDELCAGVGLPDAAHAVDAGDEEPLQRRALREVQDGHPHRQHRPRRTDRRSGALRAPSKAGSSAAPASTCSRRSRRSTGRCRSWRKVVATPHLAASTEEAQEQVGLDTASAVRDFLREGRRPKRRELPRRSLPTNCSGCSRGCAWPRVWPPWSRRWGRRASSRSALRYYGALADSRAAEMLASSAAAGVLRPILSGGVSVVNARAAAKERGIEIVETRSSRRATSPAWSRSSCTRATANAGPKARCSSRTTRGWCRCAASTSKRRSPARC